MISMLRGCRPSERTALLGSPSFSSTSTSTSCSRNSAASIIPVGPPPLMITSNTRNPDSRTHLPACGSGSRNSPQRSPSPQACRPRPAILFVGGGLAASPLPSHILKVAGRFVLLAFRESLSRVAGGVGLGQDGRHVLLDAADGEAGLVTRRPRRQADQARSPARK